METTKIKIKFGDLTPRELVEGFESIHLYRNQDNNKMMVEYAARCKKDLCTVVKPN